METIFVRPAPGARVRDPATKAPIPDIGLLVPNTGYWQRRILAGDVVVTTEAAQPKPKSKE